MRSAQLFLVLGATVIAVAKLVFSADPRPKPSGLDELVVGQPIVFQNLVVFPVSARTPRLTDRFITLDEGLRTGKVEILEVGAADSAAPSTADVHAAPTPQAQGQAAADPPAQTQKSARSSDSRAPAAGGAETPSTNCWSSTIRTSPCI
jgi:hypothetical protein